MFLQLKSVVSFCPMFTLKGIFLFCYAHLEVSYPIKHMYDEHMIILELEEEYSFLLTVVTLNIYHNSPVEINSKDEGL